MTSYDDDRDTIGAISGVGQIIGGFIFFGFGQLVKRGNIAGKWNVLTQFIKTVGIVSVIEGIFNLASSVVSGAITIAIGLILLFIYKKMTDGKVETLDKINWIILMILFVIQLVVSIIAILDFPIGTLIGICNIIIYVFMLISLLDKETKNEMGM